MALIIIDQDQSTPLRINPANDLIVMPDTAITSSFGDGIWGLPGAADIFKDAQVFILETVAALDDAIDLSDCISRVEDVDIFCRCRWQFDRWKCWYSS